MTPLHDFGNFCREMFLRIPLPIVRWVFLALLFAIWIWVLLLPRSETTPPDREGRSGENLKLWASAAILLQVLIYSFL